MDTVRRVGHPASLYLVAATLFAVSLLGLPQASLAGFGNDIATYDVKWSNPSPANGSFIKWTMSFGTLFPGEDPNGTGTGGLFAGNFPPILVETDVPPGVTGCCLLQGGALITLDQVQFFLSSTDPRCCVDFGNFDLFQRPFSGPILSFSAVSFIASSASPGDFENTFTFTDPPGLDFAILFHPDFTSELLSSQGAQITRTFGTSPPGLVPPPSAVPGPSTALLLGAGLAGLAAVTWRGKRR